MTIIIVLRHLPDNDEDTMKAFIIDRYGKQETGRIADMPRPQPQDDEVLVQVHAAGVNALDVKIRNGEFKMILPYRLPLILGNDVAGTVVQVGPQVRRFRPGDAVFGRPDQDRIGGFAEFISVREAALAHKPASLGMEEAASVPLVALTAWQVLVETARLQPGQKVLIHAGSGGVGSIAIQLAKHLGAYVATTAGSANAGWVKELGADLVIDYKTQDFSALLHDYDVVLNSLGDEVLEKSLAVLKPGGRLISISGPPTPAFARAQGLGWPLRLVTGILSYGIRKRCARRGIDYDFVFMRADGAQLGEIAGLIDNGRIRPVIDQVFPLAATADALAYVEQGRAKGKVVVRID